MRAAALADSPSSETAQVSEAHSSRSRQSLPARSAPRRTFSIRYANAVGENEQAA